MAGRSRSCRRDTVAWEQPKMSPATSWGIFVRISATTMATDLYSPITAELPPGLTTSPVAGRGTRGQLGQLPLAQPCHSLKPQRLLPGVSRLCDSTGFKREAVLIASPTRRQMLIHRRICGHVENLTELRPQPALLNKPPGLSPHSTLRPSTSSWVAWLALDLSALATVTGAYVSLPW